MKHFFYYKTSYKSNVSLVNFDEEYPNKSNVSLVDFSKEYHSKRNVSLVGVELIRRNLGIMTPLKGFARNILIHNLPSYDNTSPHEKIQR